MGAIHFSVDPELVGALRRVLPLRVFFETGTFRGDTAAAVAPEFEKVHTVEVSVPVHARAAARLSAYRNVSVILGNSPAVLRELGGQLASASVLYWLDAHWCGGETGGAQQECPLLAELDAIGTLNSQSAVLIDDARLFLAPPPEPHAIDQWPLLEEVVGHLRRLSRTHKLWIINDVFVFVPPAAFEAVIRYGRARGVDLAQLARAAGRGAGVPRPPGP